MGGGCLVALGRLTTRVCLRLGAFVASVLLRSLAFLLLNVIGPFCLGMTREIIRRMVAVWRGRRRGAGPSVLGGIGYALAGGMVWVGGYFFVCMILALLLWAIRLLLHQLALPVPVWLPFVAVGAFLFLVGAIAGALAHRYEDEPLFRS